MRILLTLSLLAATMLAAPISRAAAQTTSACLPADSIDTGLVDQLAQWATETDPERRADRDTLYKVPVVPVSDLTIVMDAKVCTSAAQAHGPRPGESALPRVYVVKIGRSGYAVLDPILGGARTQAVRIFDTIWRRIGGWVGP